MAVPLYDHAAALRRTRPAIDAAIARVLDSGRLDWGDEVPAFEAEFAAFVGAAHCVTVNSGTAAIKVALLALGIGPGDEVITAPNTDIGTVSAIHHTGARAVFAEVSPGRLTLDPGAVAAAIGPRTRAILPVDLYGQPADLPALAALARRHGLAVVEDACLALGAEVGGVRVGSLADVTCFSFAPTKHLGSVGSGGACCTQDAALSARMIRLSAYGQDRSRHRGIATGGVSLRHETDGLNERLDEIQAAVLRARLPDLPATLALRRAQAARYAALLAGACEVPDEAAGTRHAWRTYTVHLDRRDAVREGLARRGIGSSMSYAPPLHLHPFLAGRAPGPGAFPVAERSGARLLCLPIGPHLPDDAQEEVAAGLRAAVAEAEAEAEAER